MERRKLIAKTLTSEKLQVTPLLRGQGYQTRTHGTFSGTFIDVFIFRDIAFVFRGVSACVFFTLSLAQEFSLAREQREEEIEKERLLKEKEAAKERRERQARLDRLAKRLKRRNRSKGSGPAPSVAGETRDLPTCLV